MAQPIHCDVHDRGHAADVLVSRLEDGSTMAACNAGYVELCMAIADQARAELQSAQDELVAQAAAEDAREADDATADALARLADATPAAQADDQDAPRADELDQDTETALAILGPDAGPQDQDDSDQLAVALAAERSHPDVDPATVVRKGTSRSRAAYEARQRARAADPVPEPIPEPSEAPGPPEGPQDQPSEAAATA